MPPLCLCSLLSAAFRFENFAQVTPGVVLSKLPETHPWLTQTKLVAKPDQLIKRRGKVRRRQCKCDTSQFKRSIGIVAMQTQCAHLCCSCHPSALRPV